MKHLCLIILCLIFLTNPLWSSETRKLNLLIITVDDMSADSIGEFGCKLNDTTPRIDQLIRSGMKFKQAHVQVGNCMPSRNVMWSGRYPHTTKVEGFRQVKDASYPHLVDLTQQAGYFTAIRGKVSHSTPYAPYKWDKNLDTLPDGRKAHIKDIDSYGISMQDGITSAQKAGKPFCVVMNVSDPHKPFYAEGKGGATVPDEFVPSRIFTPEEVPIPGFLFDDPVSRKELSHYYSSVRRADDCVGKILDVLDKSGQRANTAILFLSDHGMPLPFAKTQLYHHSTHTPLAVIWPEVTKAGSVDNQHMVSAVDLLPTLLDILNIPQPAGIQGRSFASLLKGETQTGRDFVIKEYNENSGGDRSPMRAIETKDYLYIFNPWSNGVKVMATATAGTSTNRRMIELGKNDSYLASRVDLIQHRVPEELYHVHSDPDCLKNLVGVPQQQAELNRLQTLLENWMKETNDPLLEIFQKRNNEQARAEFIDSLKNTKKGDVADDDGEAKPKPAANKKAAKAAGGKKNMTKNNNDQKALDWKIPETIKPGSEIKLEISYHTPQPDQKQKLHITVKEGKDAKRLERQVIEVTGDGKQEVTFKLPDTIKDQTISFAVFMGEDFNSHLEILQSKLIEVK